VRPLALLLFALAPLAPAHAADLESPPLELAARERAPAALLSGPHHRVVDPVVNDGFMDRWTIASDWGEMTAASDALLRVRVHEIGALAELAEVTNSDAFREAFEKALTGRFYAAREVVQHPIETAKRIPSGVSRMIKRTTRRVRNLSERAEEKAEDLEESREEKRRQEEAEAAAREAGEEPAAESDEERAARREEQLEQAKGVASDVGEEGKRQFQRLVGYRKARLAWAKELGVDPYGDNEPLDEELFRVAAASAAGGLPIRFAPIPNVPGLDELAGVNSLVYDLDGLDLRLRNEAIFFDLGFTRPQVDRLYDARVWGDTLITDLADATKRLGEVSNLELLFEWALEAADRDEARFQAAVARQLADVHEARSPIARLVAFDNLLGARLADGAAVLPLAVDRLAWTETAAALLADAGEAFEIREGEALELRLLGDASPAARAAIAARGVRLAERGF